MNDKPEAFLWPKGCNIWIYDLDGKTLVETKDRGLDLADSLMLYYKAVFVVFQLNTNDGQKIEWNEPLLKSVEEQIKYDLEFDGYTVDINRCDDPCTATNFAWELDISELEV
jgi:hypothetical protein